MFRDIIDKLEATEQEIMDLKRDKAQAEQFLALVMSYIGEIEVDATNLYKVDPDKVRLLPNKDNELKVNVLYVRD